MIKTLMPMGGGDHSDLDHANHEDAEPDGVESKGFYYREKDGNRQQDDTKKGSADSISFKRIFDRQMIDLKPIL